MMNRRKLIGATAATVTSGAIGTNQAVAQLADSGLEFQNASFIVNTNDATPVASPNASPVPIDIRGYILGDPDAPHTLQIYADYRCPHCRAFSVDIEPQLIEDFVNPGRLNIEYLDFTVIGVPSFEELGDDTIESVQAAEAAACAAEQDSYLDFREWLFDGPTRTSEGDFSDDNLVNAAEALGLDVEMFSESLLSGKYEQAIIDSVSLGLNRGVQGTPAMTLNSGEAFYVPENGYKGIREILENELGS